MLLDFLRLFLTYLKPFLTCTSSCLRLFLIFLRLFLPCLLLLLTCLWIISMYLKYFLTVWDCFWHIWDSSCLFESIPDGFGNFLTYLTLFLTCLRDFMSWDSCRCIWDLFWLSWVPSQFVWDPSWHVWNIWDTYYSLKHLTDLFIAHTYYFEKLLDLFEMFLMYIRLFFSVLDTSWQIWSFLECLRPFLPYLATYFMYLRFFLIYFKAFRTWDSPWHIRQLMKLA